MAMSLMMYKVRKRRHLICGICQDVYRCPRLLPCHHSFCLDCVKELVRLQPREFPCPECRKPTLVPKNGALGFQLNFHIPEEDLELERNGAKTTPCPNHVEDPLLFFCVPCDQPICLRCKWTSHDHHQTQDLCEAAARCGRHLEASKERLEEIINHVSNFLSDAYANLDAVTLKESVLLREVQAQRDAIVARVDKCCDKAKGDVRQLSHSLTTRLKQDTQNMQQKLDSLLHLRQRLNCAFNTTSDVEKISMEKEMRQGEGSEEELNKVKECMPSSTMRPGVHRDDSAFCNDTIHHCLGSAVCFSFPFSTTVSEVITPVFQCGQDRSQCREVHNVCHIDENTIGISFGGIAPHYSEEQQACISEKGCKHSSESLRQGKVCFHKDNKNALLYTVRKPCDETTQIASNGSKTMFVKYTEKNTYCTISRSKITSMETFVLENNGMFNVDCEKPAAFSATEDEQLFAIIEEKASKHSRKPQLNVLLFRQGGRQPFTTYTPSDKHFHPADLCFRQEDDQVKLLVADTHSDSVHVVRMEDKGCCFERYLAAGNGNLVGPTALDVDDKGNVWIGCSNGWILKCEKLSDDKESHVNGDGDSEESVSGSLLQVDNTSQVTGTVSEVSTE